MKRTTPLFFILPACLLLLTGCSQKTTPAASDQTSDNPSRQPAGDAPREMRRPDFGQPEREADITGVIKSVLGNEVSVLKIDMTRKKDGQTISSSTEDVSPDGEKSTSGPAISIGGNMPAGGPGGMPGDRRNEESDNSRTEMLAALKEMSTGEEKITIPVGIKMLKPSTDSQSGKREMVEATLSDLTADKMITIWLNQTVTDKKVAEFVLIN